MPNLVTLVRVARAASTAWPEERSFSYAEQDFGLPSDYLIAFDPPTVLALLDVAEAAGKLVEGGTDEAIAVSFEELQDLREALAKLEAGMTAEERERLRIIAPNLRDRGLARQIVALHDALVAAEAERDEARADAEQAATERDIIAHDRDGWLDRFREVRADAERLAEALREIADASNTSWLADAARAALAKLEPA